ncbi:MAG TPA: penicillin-binding protein 2 [Candidatus Gracilibacteria bacterium]
MQGIDFGTRLKVLNYAFVFLFLIFGVRLFTLQVLQHDGYLAEAKAQHEKRSVLPARRGKILVYKNRLSKEVTPLATNNTLKKLFVDPLILAYPSYNAKLTTQEQEPGDPGLVAQLLAPLLIHSHCEKVDGCLMETDISKVSEDERIAIEGYRAALEEQFNKKERDRVVLETELAPTKIEEIKSLRISGLGIEGASLVANPLLIVSPKETAEKLTGIINLPERDLENLLGRRPVRYLEITDKIVPEVSQAILDLKDDDRYRLLMRGVRLVDEHWRYYPEKSLASQVLGFVDQKGYGQYGIEKRFDHLLRGKEGLIYGATNTRGQRILDKSSSIARALDGADIVLTIDRVIQAEIERILAEDLQRFDANFGQVIVVEPQTGKILAMAQGPDFDPNDFGKAYLRYEISPEQEQGDREDPTFNQRIPTVFEKGHYYRYYNVWGPEVFRNKLVSDQYEPGSVMKAMTMALALNADEVTPQTTYDDNGPLEVDEFKIRNSDEVYAGDTTMIEVLNRSLNTGIAFITRKMGAKAVYDGLKAFGFGQYTDIELDGELSGDLEYWTDWAESELITRGYGQGISATPLQTVLAFAALANGGYLMKPILIEEIRHSDGEVKVFESEKVRRVISDKTYNTIKSMLKNAVNNGIARGGRVWGHTVMGKTGTSQTYDRAGRLLTGEGTTITTFAGFGPFNDPAFVILVKYDYPKVSQWGSETAAVTFRKVAEYLFQYYGIPPDQ